MEASAELFQWVAETRRGYQQFLRPHLDEMGNQQVKALTCLRRELGLQADGEKMLEESRGAREEIFDQVDSLFHTLGMGLGPKDDDDRDEDVTAAQAPGHHVLSVQAGA